MAATQQRDVLASGHPLMFSYYTRFKQTEIPIADSPADLPACIPIAIDKLVAALHDHAARGERIYVTGYFSTPYIDAVVAEVQREAALSGSPEMGTAGLAPGRLQGSADLSARYGDAVGHRAARCGKVNYNGRARGSRFVPDWRKL